MLVVSEISNAERLSGLEGEWKALFARSAENQPFQSWEWVSPYCRHMALGTLRILTARDGCKLVAVLPLIEERQFCGVLRRLRFIGEDHSDYNAILSETGRERESWLAILGYLHTVRNTWDLIELSFLREGSTLAILEKTLPLRLELRLCRRCPVTALSGNWMTFHSRLRTNLRSNISRRRRQLVRDVGADITTACESDIDIAIEDFFRLHSLRWATRGYEGAFAHPRIQAWHREVARGFLRAGWLRLHRLSVSGQGMATIYCFRAGNRVIYNNAGFDPSLSKYSPGLVLLAYAIESAMLEGIEYFDFARGTESYKYEWNVHEENVYRLIIGNGTVRSRMAECLIKVRTKMEMLGGKLYNLIFGRKSFRNRVSSHLRVFVDGWKRRWSGKNVRS